MSDPSDVSDDENSAGVKNMVPKKPFAVNNVRGLQDKLKEIRLNLDWIEKLDITIDPLNPDSGDPASSGQNNTPAENDFKREMTFYNQALSAVDKAFKRLRSLNVPIQRPDDYLAEMAKSDAHMQKVREKLLNKQVVVERTEKVRALREQKKQGKKIQREIIQQRKVEKKKMITALKKAKKGKMAADSLLNEQRKPKPGKVYKGKKNKEFKDMKFGYGGKKKGSKRNTAESSAMFSGNVKRDMKMHKGKSNMGKQRLSKHRRRR